MKAYTKVEGCGKWGQHFTLGYSAPLYYRKIWIVFIGTRYGNCFQYPLGTRYENCFQNLLEGLSETSNNQALLNPFYRNINMKAYMRVEGWGTLYLWVDCPPLPQANINYVHRDEMGEIVCSILLKGFQKLQISRVFSSPLS